ncbi:MAG: coproporphyrinogen III oxidase [Dictyoglomus sp. NZ13-RE01]|nr:MAG: coproporphyrinogen III oxidase [Dictyoglomus sp. NZ13-RE01]
MRRIGIYIHYPFCIHKCPYCDFVSFRHPGKEDEDIYVEYLIKEIGMRKDDEFIVDTIYFGGGTPSLLLTRNLELILNFISKNFKMDSNLEITIEANPGTINSFKLRHWTELGINRVSLGVQSFLEKELKFLGRLYLPRDIYKSFNFLRDYGFNNINFDIIYSLPGQDLMGLSFSLDKAVELNPEHISLYNLMIEEGTQFYERYKRGELKLLSDDEEAKLYEFSIDFLNSHGYTQYEISNFSKMGKFPCKHNLKYWRHEEFLGFGVSAYSFISSCRYGNYKDLYVYYEKIREGKFPFEEIEYLVDDDLAKDEIFVRLRLMEGINMDEFKKKYNKDLREYFPNYEMFIKKNFLKEEKNYLKLTRKGLLLWNEILLDIF